MPDPHPFMLWGLFISNQHISKGNSNGQIFLFFDKFLKGKKLTWCRGQKEKIKGKGLSPRVFRGAHARGTPPLLLRAIFYGFPRRAYHCGGNGPLKLGRGKRGPPHQPSFPLLLEKFSSGFKPGKPKTPKPPLFSLPLTGVRAGGVL